MELDFLIQKRRQSKNMEIPEFFFDDEPLEKLLYGEKQGEPTSANLYLATLKYVREIFHELNKGETQHVINIAAELGTSEAPISIKTCSMLAYVMRQIVPDFPNPVTEFDLSGLGPLMNQLWNVAINFRDDHLQRNAGSPIYRWYEHHGQYDKARNVLKRLVEIYHEKGNWLGEAVMINNLAFEFYLEGRYAEALPLFEKAVVIYRQNNETYEAANSRANYWECRFNIEGIEDLAHAEPELLKISTILGKRFGRHARKPLILLARIEEHRGNMEKAIKLIKKAISMCEDSKTRYPDLDTEYLECLKKKIV